MKPVKAIFLVSLLFVGAALPATNLAATQAVSAVPAITTQPLAQKVNINTADAATLETVPGMTKHAAQAITAFRDAHGPFKSVSDLAFVQGIHKRTFNKIAGSLTV